MLKVLEELEKSFENFPDDIAIVSGQSEITYAELARKVDQIEHALTESSLQVGETVGIFLEDRYFAIASIVAILRRGCGYLPLDPVYPENRLSYMIEDSGIRFLIADADQLPFSDAVSVLDAGTLKWANVENQPESSVSENPGYLIYTSGSTGTPKGVQLPLNVLDNLIGWQNSRYEKGTRYRTAQFTALSFDVSFQEIFSTLCAAGTLCLVPLDVKQDFRKLIQFVDDSNIERLFMPYIAVLHLAQWASRLDIFPQSLRELITAGEQLVTNQEIRKLFRNCPDAILCNQYGPSETHVVSEYVLAKNVDEWEEIPPIGNPVAGAEFVVVNDDLAPVEQGEVGELLIAGPVLADGYRNKPDQTSERFINLTLGKREVRCYRSGDLVSQVADGAFVYKGRSDSQVKINGFRVEMTEVEVALMQLPAVKEAAVAVSLDDSAGKKLVAFVVAADDQVFDVQALQSALVESLPAYMVPKQFIERASLLKTPSGKIDRKSMLSAVHRRDDQRPVKRGNSKQRFLELIRDTLSNQQIEPEDNLLDVGMDSIGANQLSGAFLDDLGLDVPAYQFFQHKTVAALIKHISGNNETRVGRMHSHNEKTQSSNDIAIIGFALDVPGATSSEDFWQMVEDGGEAVHFFQPVENNVVNARGILKDPTGFDASFFQITPSEAEITDPQQRKLLELAWHGLEDSGYVPETFGGRIGVFCGTGNNSYYLNNVLRSQEKLEDYGSFPAMIANEKDYCATRISHKLNLTGPAINVQSACSTSLVAICMAVQSLRNGECDMAIAGAASITYPQQQPYTYEDGSIYSKDGHTRTFDADSNGTVFSDGAAVVVLKKLDYALADNDNIVAVIKGVGLNNDGGDKGSFSAPSIEGQKRVIATAQNDAGLSAADIGYIEAHGTATPIGDPIEVAALTEVFRQSTQASNFCSLGSVKSNIGHLTAAAGVAGLIKSALAIKKGIIPPSANFENPNPALNLENTPFTIEKASKAWDKPVARRFAGVSSFGIGGTNAHVVLAGIEPVEERSDDAQSDFPLCISAKSEAALLQYIGAYKDLLDRNADVSIARISRAAFNCRDQMPWRFAAYGVTADQLREQLSHSENLDTRQALKSPKVVFLFSGQGTQLPKMGRELYSSLPVFKDSFDHCAAICAAHGVDLKALVLEGQGDINLTRNTQLALFSVCYSLERTVRDFGVIPDALFGHSIGELVAATISGVFDLETALHVVATRGSVMQAQPAGSMIAVRANPADIEPMLNADCVVAAINAPDSCTISGTDDGIEALSGVLEASNFSFTLLETSHAFHSPMMDAAAEQFAETLSKVTLNPPTIPFISCVSGDWITEAEATDINYWASQIRQPVQFKLGCEKILEYGSFVSIEVGPKNVLSGLLNLTKLYADDSDGADRTGSVQLMPHPGKPHEHREFMSAIGKAWQLGLAIQERSAATPMQRRVKIPVYPFQQKTFEIQPDGLMPAAAAPQPMIESAEPQEHSGERTMKNEAIAQLKKLFSDTSGMDLETVSLDSSFFEIGFDSLFLTQSISKLKREFGVSITFRQLMNDLNSLNALAGYIADNSDKLKPAVSTGAQPAAAAPSATPIPAVAAPVVNPMTAVTNIQATVDGQQVAASDSLVALFSQQIQMINSQISMLQGSLQAPGESHVPAPSVSHEAPPAAKRSLKPFGAGTRINVKRSNELTESQQAQLDKLSTRYNRKFKSSKKFAQDNRQRLADPRVVSGFRNPIKEVVYPIVVDKSEGPYLWDIDGHKFVDITCGFGSNFFGNSAPFVKEAIAQQLERGYEIGPQHPLVADASKLFCEVTGNDRAAFCNTGSEAVIGALRLARTVTAKEKVVMFENDYHGMQDEVIVTRGSNGYAMPAAAGIPDGSVENVIVLDYGDDKSLDYIVEHADEIAAILFEPVQSRFPEIQPREFLKKARQICDENDIAFIFDEVITGFRIHQRGAQGFFGIDADICTYGKIVGGGMPIGVIAGKSQYMDALDGGQWQFGDDSSPEIGVTYFAGTFVRHPFALAAAVAVLTKLKAEPDLQLWLNARADRMVTEINDYAGSVGAPLKIANCGSMCKIKIPQDIPYEELIYVLLREKGVHVWDARPTFITTAHSDDDIQFIVDAFKSAIDDMLQMEFFPVEEGKSAPPPQKDVRKSASKKRLFKPPVPGAKLGRDEEGKAVWYVPSKQGEGQFEKWAG